MQHEFVTPRNYALFAIENLRYYRILNEPVMKNTFTFEKLIGDQFHLLSSITLCSLFIYKHILNKIVRFLA